MNVCIYQVLNELYHSGKGGFYFIQVWARFIPVLQQYDTVNQNLKIIEAQIARTFITKLDQHSLVHFVEKSLEISNKQLKAFISF